MRRVTRYEDGRIEFVDGDDRIQLDGNVVSISRLGAHLSFEFETGAMAEEFLRAVGSMPVQPGKGER